MPLRRIDTRTRFTDLGGTPLELDYDNIHHRDEVLTGLGDVQLLAHSGWSLAGFALGARAGLSLPTGEVHEDPFRLGREGRAHQHLQFGTGTFDPVLALDVARSVGRVTLSSFAQAQVPLYEGRHGYRAGARLLGGVAASRGLGPVTARLAATIAHERAERWSGEVPAEDGNLGRTDLFLGPGVTVPVATDLGVSVDLGVRVFGHTVNAQLDMPVVLSVSVGGLLHLESGRHVEPLPDGPGVAAAGDVADAVVAGEAAPLAAAAGRWTVFDFWATWCEACGKLDHELRALARDDARIAVRRVNIVDLDSPIARRELRGVTTLPHVRLVDPAGRIAWEASGPPAELMRGIRARIGASAPR